MDTSRLKDAIGDLCANLRRDLLEPDQPANDEARKIWNGMINKRPGLIAQCTGAADVLTAVRFAREHDLLVSVKGGGQNVARGSRR